MRMSTTGRARRSAEESWYSATTPRRTPTISLLDTRILGGKLTFTKALTPEQEKKLAEEYLDGLKVKELSIFYRVSVRTVYRILAEQKVPKKAKKGRRKFEKSKPRQLKPCGTDAAYQRHRRNGEYPCTACLEAHAAGVKRSKTKSTKWCGSVYGWRLHRRRNEIPCSQCRAALALRRKRQRQRKKEAQRADSNPD